MDSREEQLRQRAYQLWEREGRPQGRAEEHWRQAEAMEGDEERVEAGEPGDESEPKPQPDAATRVPPEEQRTAQADTARFYDKQPPARPKKGGRRS